MLELPQGFLPIGITLYQGNMFISDWTLTKLIYATQTGANAVLVGPGDFARINFVQAISSDSATNIGRYYADLSYVSGSNN